MRNWITCLVVLFCIAFGLLVFLTLTGDLHAYKIPTGGMKPTLESGDLFYAERLSYRFRKPRRGDILVFSTEGIWAIDKMRDSGPAPIYVQRVIGLPGDRVELRHGDLLINGSGDPSLEALKLEMPPGPRYLRDDNSPVDVPADSYFVVGDNRYNSYDSRFWGFLAAKSIKGRACFRYWPLSRLGFL